MKINTQTIQMSQGKNQFSFLPTGDIHTFRRNQILVNQLRGNIKDGAAGNIWLRIHSPQDKNVIKNYPLLGIHSNSRLEKDTNALRYSGAIDSIQYQVIFRFSQNTWFWTVQLTGNCDYADLVYGQDLGMAVENTVYTNEAYTSQYLGHSVFKKEDSYVVCSRQNMPFENSFPYIQQGVIGSKAIHYSTDGLQFFGLSYKQTGTPSALESNLEDCILQYEFAYTALQTEVFALNGTKEITFYALFQDNHEEAIDELEFQDILLADYNSLPTIQNWETVPQVNISKKFSSPYSSPSFTSEELDKLYPKRKLTEEENGTILSFFTPDHAHVVTLDKEMICERPHGTIIITPPDTEHINSHLITSTQYMYGVFLSHIAIGNTDVHKFISTPRGFLNLLKNDGCRIYIRLEDTYHLLTLPGVFEMGMNYARWYYKIKKDVLCITAYTTAGQPSIVLEAQSTTGQTYDIILTCQLALKESESDISIQSITNGLHVSMNNTTYPNLQYDLFLSEQNVAISDDRIFFEQDQGFDESFLSMKFTSQDGFTLSIHGQLSEEAENPQISSSFEEEKKMCLAYYETLIRNFYLEWDPDIHSPHTIKQLEILNETAWWYAHNAMIHYSMPHGLEQPSGAAWGTRDICQGPFEFFLATQHFKLTRNILLTIFSHQSEKCGEWPQWFMFDRYPMNAGECHGDVIFWPLKCAADYLEATGDIAILDEQIRYEDSGNASHSLLEHINLAVKTIQKTRMIGDTGLITYAGGDWDDTLQPANEDMKEHLVSAWTMALAYQTLHSLGNILPESAGTLAASCNQLAASILSAFETILIKDNVIAGFLEYCNPPTFLLHPDDEITGIHYRLLPLTRSIIAELVSPEQAQINMDLIAKHLAFPDGVRLMNRPTQYNGGVSRLFKRAEQAANVGREISLQYIHAHIRYIEALAKMGTADEAWNSLFTVNPILLKDTLPHGRTRQSNLYFSSSEGAFGDRYDYAENFSKLKTKEIEVKGGWRLYSSGPGIYLHQLTANLLGIRFHKDGLIIDPALPNELSGVRFSYTCYNIRYEFIYHAAKSQDSNLESLKNTIYAVCNETILPSEPQRNPYRRGGILIRKENLPKTSCSIYLYNI